MQRKENSLQSKANIQLKSLSNDVIINEMKCRKIPLEDLPDEMIINEVKRRKISLQKLEHLPEEFISANRSKLEEDIFQPQLKKRKLASFEVRKLPTYHDLKGVLINLNFEIISVRALLDTYLAFVGLSMHFILFSKKKCSSH